MNTQQLLTSMTCAQCSVHSYDDGTMVQLPHDSQYDDYERV